MPKILLTKKRIFIDLCEEIKVFFRKVIKRLFNSKAATNLINH